MHPHGGQAVIDDLGLDHDVAVHEQSEQIGLVPGVPTSVIHIVSPGWAGSVYGFTMTRLSTSFDRMYRTVSLIACVRFTSALTKFSAVRTFSSILVMGSAGSRCIAFLACISAKRSVAPAWMRSIANLHPHCRMRGRWMPACGAVHCRAVCRLGTPSR